MFVLQRDTVGAASEFAKRNQLPSCIQNQLLSHICLKFRTEGLKQQETLKGLPKAIQSSISHHLFFPIVQNVRLFQGVSIDYLFQLVTEMEAEYFPPKEDVILQNEAPTDLYILVSGAVDLIAKIDGHEQVLGKAISGEMFGEIGVLCHRPQPFTVRTTEISQILRLNRTALMNIIQANPEDGHIIMNNFYQKLEGIETSCFKHKSPNGDPLIQEPRNTEVKEKERTGNTRIINRYGVDENSTAEDSQTALHGAVRGGHLETVRILLERGANVNKPDAKGWTAKALAEQQGNKCIYDLLLSYENRRSIDEHKIEFLAEASDNTRDSQFKPTQNGVTSCSSSYVKNSIFVPSSNSSNHTETKGVKQNKRRVTIHMKCLKNNVSQKQLPKLIILPDSIEDLFRIAGQKFGGYNLTKIVNSENAEIDDLNVIRDGDHLFLIPE